MTLLAIDPGVQCTGWAVFELDHLIACGLSRAKTLEEQVVLPLPIPDADQLVIVLEEPQVRRDTPRPDDLIKLAMVVGAKMAQAARFKDVEFIRCKPRSWKGSVPKDIHNHRTLALLSPKESAIVSQVFPEGLRHNAIDAVGLGLWALKRRKA